MGADLCKYCGFGATHEGERKGGKERVCTAHSYPGDRPLYAWVPGHPDYGKPPPGPFQEGWCWLCERCHAGPTCDRLKLTVSQDARKAVKAGTLPYFVQEA